MSYNTHNNLNYMIKEYEIFKMPFTVDIDKQTDNLIINNPNVDLSKGLIDTRTRKALKLHIKGTIKNSINVNTILKHLMVRKIEAVSEEIVDLIHISLILKHN